jgi:hypothetical protein
MWLYVPTTSRSLKSPLARGCSPRQLSLLSPRSECVPEPSATVSGTPQRRPLLWRGWKTRPYIRLLSGMTLGHWIANRGVERLICSVRAIRASRSRRPASDLATAILATFGQQSVERLRELNPASCSWRTWTRMSDLAEEKSFGICKGLATWLRRDCSRRLNAARATRENGCSSSEWQTPTGQGHTSRKQAGATKREPLLPNQATAWPTPNATDDRATAGCRGPVKNPTLRTAVKAWATPEARDWKVGKIPHHKGSGPLSYEAEMWATPNTARRGAGKYRKENSKGGDKDLQREVETDKWPCPDTLPPETTSLLGLLLQVWTPPECPRLNPRFAEWLMGWPLGLTSCGLSATEWTLWWRHTLFCLCSLVSSKK